jgi:hypothetical protein
MNLGSRSSGAIWIIGVLTVLLTVVGGIGLLWLVWAALSYLWNTPVILVVAALVVVGLAAYAFYRFLGREPKP